MAQVRADEELRADVIEELAWDSLVDESQIGAAVRKGVITLVGTVDSYAQKLAAESAAEAVEGLHSLQNEIDVRPSAQSQTSDDVMKAIVEQVLTWDALVPNEDLFVAVSGGWVTISGAVTVAAQRREADRVVSHLVGVRGVTNEITIEEPDLTPADVRAAIENALRRRATHRAANIDITVDGATVVLAGFAQSSQEKVAILGAVSHAPGIDVVFDDLRVGEPVFDRGV